MAHAPLHQSHVPQDDWHVPLAGLWLALAAILVIAAIFGVAVLTQ